MNKVSVLEGADGSPPFYGVISRVSAEAGTIKAFCKLEAKQASRRKEVYLVAVPTTFGLQKIKEVLPSFVPSESGLRKGK